jgi:SAM-dependent methyltransferase
MHAIEDEQSLFLRLNRRYGLRKRCNAVAEMKPSGGRLLDVGCATGVFLNGMRRTGKWEVFGVEPNASAADYARRRFGIEVHTGMLREAGYPDEHFDVVSLWHVIEHVLEPVADLREVRRILKPNGLLVLTTPNLDSFDARLFGRFWAGLETPRHLFVFSLSTLTRLLSGLGFELVRKRCINGTWWAFATSIQFLAEEKLRRVPSQGKLWEGFRIILPLRLLLLPYFLTADRLGKGSNITLFFVRRP